MPIQFALDFSAAAAAPVPADYWRPEDFVAAPVPPPAPAPADPWDAVPAAPVVPAPVSAAEVAADAAAARLASRPRRSFRRVPPPAPADSAAAVAAFLASRSVTVCPVRYAAPVAGC